MITFTDQMGREITLPAPPKRIVSIVPSQTELLHDLGLEEEVIGITKFCVHPQSWFRSKTRIGGTKALHLDQIAELKPDLIIGNKEENEQAQVEALMQDFPVWMSDIKTLPDACTMIEQLGKVCAREEKANAISQRIRDQFNVFKAIPRTTRSVAYFIWRNPYMAAGNDTFIDHLLRVCGFENVLAGLPGRYPEVSPEQLQEANPEIILLSSEPYPFAEKHFEEFRALVPDADVLTVDGEMFSWYGSRLLLAPAYFELLLEEIRTT